MRRREYLAAASGSTITLISGCMGSAEGPSTNDNMRQPPDARRKLTLHSVSGTPEGSPISFDIEVEDPWITPSSTASFKIATSNKDEVAREVGPAFYKGTSAQFGRAGIVVYNHRARDFDIENYVPPCFSDSSRESYVRTSQIDNEQTVVFTREGIGAETIEPSSTRVEECIVADDPTTDGCFPSANYQLESAHSIEGSQVSLSFKLGIDAL